MMVAVSASPWGRSARRAIRMMSVTDSFGAALFGVLEIVRCPLFGNGPRRGKSQVRAALGHHERLVSAPG